MPRMALLGLCTTAEITGLPPHEREVLRHRLCKVLLNRTTENTMSHVEHLGEGFECSALDAFEYAGLDLSPRMMVNATGKGPQGMVVVAGDMDVGALIWVGKVIEAGLDEVERRCLVLWMNWARRRVVGMPAPSIWVRELLWRTVAAVIMYIGCLDARY